MNVKSPCDRDCPNRSIACHGKCEKYISWKNRRDKLKAEMYRESRKMADLDEALRKYHRERRR